MDTQRIIEAIIAVLVFYWWSGGLYRAVIDRSILRGSLLLPLGILFLYWLLLALQIDGFSRNYELRSFIFRVWFALAALIEGTIKFNGLFGFLWQRAKLQRSSSASSPSD